MIEKRKAEIEDVVLIGIITNLQDEDKSKEYLVELEFLTYTAGGKAVKRFTQKFQGVLKAAKMIILTSVLI